MSEIVPTTPVGGEVAVYDDSVTTGLEDFETTDAVMPIIRIEHKDGVFVDGLSGETFPELKIIILGLIKQRVLWEADLDESSKGPMCRSYDFKSGIPDPERFPWKSSGFDKTLVDADPALPCDSCLLKNWGTHPKRDAPWCSEQHTFAILQPMDEDGNLAPSLLTVQRSAVKPSKTYLTSFSRTKTPLFTVWTKITLDGRKKGSVEYCVPKFIRADETDRDDWPFFAETYRQIREYVQTPRVREDEEDASVPGAAPATAPPDPGASTPTVAAPAPAAADDDDLPF